MDTVTEKEKKILFVSIRLMICVGHADGYIGEKEVNWIYQQVEGTHFSLRERQILMNDIDVPKTPASIIAELIPMTLQEKLILLRQLYHFALVDRKIRPTEEAAIKEIAALLEISEEKQAIVAAWIAEGIEWKKRWEDIVAE